MPGKARKPPVKKPKVPAKVNKPSALFAAIGASKMPKKKASNKK